MVATSQEKTEDPTPKRLRDARQRGQVARSQDLLAGLLMSLAVGALAVGMPGAVRAIEGALRAAFTGAAELQDGTGTDDELLAMARVAFAAGERALAPILIALVLGALAFNFAQVGALFSLEPLKLDGSRLDPVQGLRRLFLGAGPWVELAKALLKVTIVGVLLFHVLKSDLGVLLTLGRLDPPDAAREIGRVVLRLGMWVSVGILALGVLDYFYQRHRLTKELSMTLAEVKEEHKGQEGDPTHKQRRRRAHREVNEHSMVEGVAKAQVVVVNPTHIACALRYEPEQEGAPRLLAKGEGHLAERIKELARELRVPVVRDVSLARALRELELDEEIPEELFEAAVVVLRYLQDLAHARGRVMPWEEDETAGSGATDALAPR